MRELGVALLVAGVLTAAVLAGLSGRRGLGPTLGAYSWDTYTRMLGNQTVAVYIASDNMVEVPSLEGYSFELEVGIRSHIQVVVRAVNASRVAMTNVGVDLAGAEAYVLGGADAQAAMLLYRAGDWDALLRLASSKAIKRVRLRLEKSAFGVQSYKAHIPLDKGKYWVLIVAVTKRVLLPRPQPQPLPPQAPSLRPPAAVGLGIETTMSLNAVIEPTPYQYVRAADIAALGAVLLGLDYYLNREEYAEGRIARLAARLRGRRKRPRR